MSDALQLSANPVTQIIEDKLREQLKAVKRTPMGSEYVAFHASSDEVIALADRPGALQRFLDERNE